MVLDAFDRAIALDSAFGPAYIHAPEVSLPIAGPEAARRYMQAYLAKRAEGRDAQAFRLLDAMLAPDRAEDAARMLDTTRGDVLRSAFVMTRWYADSAHTALRLLQAADKRPSARMEFHPDTSQLRIWTINALAYRGRLFEAGTLYGSTRSLTLTEMALIGSVPVDSARTVFRDWLTKPTPALRGVLPWWAEQRDTVSIMAYKRWADSLHRAAPADAPARRLSAGYYTAAADAYLALARRDTVEALRRFGTLSDTACATCYTDRYVEARLLRARGGRGDLDRAASLLSQRFSTLLTAMKVPITLERARVMEQLAKPADARRLYQSVITTWEGGDAAVRPVLDSARAGLQRVSRSVASVTARP
jgi:serine/threonine-protein kinase